KALPRSRSRAGLTRSRLGRGEPSPTTPSPMARPAKSAAVEKFGPWIGVGPLMDLVEATAPFLFSPSRSPADPAPAGATRLADLVGGAEGWWHILLNARDRLASAD